MLRLSLRRHVPLLVATSSLLVGCGRSLLGDTDTGAGTETDSSSDPSDPSSPSDPSGNPSDPSDPSIATLEGGPSTDPTEPMPMSGPPRLVNATITGPSTVELFFSEPVSAAAVDPTKFRLSASFANADYSYGTFYADVGRWNGVEKCYEYCYGDSYGEGYGEAGPDGGGYGETGQNCNEWCYTPAGPSVHVIGASQVGYTDRVTLALDQQITASVCKQLQQRIDQGADAAAIFLHYSNNGQGVVDTDGEQLEAIAEHWVLLSTQYYSYQPQFFPAMDPFIPIDCPFV